MSATLSLAATFFLKARLAGGWLSFNIRRGRLRRVKYQKWQNRRRRAELEAGQRRLTEHIRDGVGCERRSVVREHGQRRRFLQPDTLVSLLLLTGRAQNGRMQLPN